MFQWILVVRYIFVMDFVFVWTLHIVNIMKD